MTLDWNEGVLHPFLDPWSLIMYELSLVNDEVDSKNHCEGHSRPTSCQMILLTNFITS